MRIVAPTIIIARMIIIMMARGMVYGWRLTDGLVEVGCRKLQHRDGAHRDDVGLAHLLRAALLEARLAEDLN